MREPVKNCSDCCYFDYDMNYDRKMDEETETFTCHKGHNSHIGWFKPPCRDFVEEDILYEDFSV